MVDFKQRRNTRNMRFLPADRLYFNNDVFSCAMVQLVHLDDDPHPLTNFEIQNYYQNEPEFDVFYSGSNLSKIKDGCKYNKS